MISKDAIANNEKILAHYLTKLSSNHCQTYVTVADKLGTWLRSDKAYYASARPKILELLEVAHATLCGVLGVNADQPFNIADCPPHLKLWVSAYVLLMQAVMPYTRHFVEPGAQDRLRRLGLPVPQSASAQVVPTATQQRTTSLPASPAVSPGKSPHANQDSQMASTSGKTSMRPLAHPPPTGPRLHAQNSPLSIQVPPPHAPVGVSYSSSGSPTQSLSLASPDILSTQANTQATQPTSSVPATPTKPRGRRKKTGSASYAEFLLADLEWYKSKDKDKDKSAPDHNADVDAETPSQFSSTLLPGQSVSSSTDRPGPSTQSNENSSASSKQSEAPSIGSPSRSPRPPGANEPPQAATSAVDGTPSITAQPQTTSAISLSDPSDNAVNNEKRISSSNIVEQPSVVPPSPSTQLDKIPGTRAVLPISTSESVPSTAAPPPSITPDHAIGEPSRIPGPSRSESTVVQLPSSRKHISSQMDVDVPEDMGTLVSQQSTSGNVVFGGHPGSQAIISESRMNVDAETNPHISKNDERMAKAPKRPRSASTSEDSGSQSVRPRIHRCPSPIIAESLEERTIYQNSTPSGNPALRPENGQVAGQSSALSGVGAPISSANQLNGSATPPKVFGREMGVIAVQRGLATKETITITFRVEEHQFGLLSIWNNRNKTVSDVSKGLCLSLGCYPIDNFRSALTDGSELTPDAVGFSRSSWPRTGGLSVNVRWKEGRQSLPLSPPFLFVTPDNLVDVSPFLEVGSNVVHIRQRHDMSEYVFVLHAHCPTPAQLKQLTQKRKVDEEWEEWRKEVTKAPEIIPPWLDIKQGSSIN